MDWLAERTEAVQDARCIVVKVGSAVLSQGDAIDLDILDNLVGQLVELHRQGRRVVLVSSGAVAAGRMALQNTMDQPLDLVGRQAAAAVGQGRLMQLYDSAFTKRDTLTALVLLVRNDLRDRRRFLNVRNTLGRLLDWGAIPVVNENDTVSIDQLKFNDNDNLASLLINPLDADLFVNLTTIGGVLDANPLKNPDAQILQYIEKIKDLDLDSLCGGKTASGTGGMHSKLLAAHRVAQLGVPTWILPGREPNIILRAFSGEMLGTWVKPDEKIIPRRKYWLAYQVEPQGVLVLDAGAADALLQRGKSLLPGGIIEVSGDFTAGTLVRLVYNDQNLGVGLSNYDSEELRKIRGKKRHEVAAILGDAHYPEVVHRDNMLLDAAI